MIFFLIPLDGILVIIGILALLGIGWATMVGAWLMAHATIVGIILLIIHIIFILGAMISLYQDYRFLGIICAAVHSVCPPLIIITSYQAMVNSGKEFGFGMMFEWVLTFLVMSLAEWLWFKAMDTEGGTSRFRLVLFTLLSVIVSLIIVTITIQEGY